MNQLSESWPFYGFYPVTTDKVLTMCPEYTLMGMVARGRMDGCARLSTLRSSDALRPVDDRLLAT
jgi:hypothetical protein